MPLISFLFILVLPTSILLLAWWATGNKIFGKILGYCWLGILGLCVLGSIFRFLTAKKVLDKKDYGGASIVYFKKGPWKTLDR